MSEQDLITAYNHAVRHRVEVQRSETCGCFHCLSVFPPTAIKSWIDTGQTAICPSCSMDAVIGSDSGFEPTEQLLEAMKERWFRASKIA
jgi:hypothetical protein